MKANIKQIRKSRRYSEDFKKEIVHSFESGEYSVLQLEKLYGIANPTIYQWIYKFSTFNEKGSRVVEMKDSQVNKLKELEEKVKKLERVVGQQHKFVIHINEIYQVWTKLIALLIVFIFSSHFARL